MYFTSPRVGIGDDNRVIIPYPTLSAKRSSFFVTFDQILNTKSLALVFSRDADEVEEFVNMIEESESNALITAVRAFHNPSPIKVKFDRAIKEFE